MQHELMRNKAIAHATQVSLIDHPVTYSIHEVHLFGKVFDFYEIASKRNRTGFGYLIDLASNSIPLEFVQFFNQEKIDILDIRREVWKILNPTGQIRLDYYDVKVKYEDIMALHTFNFVEADDVASIYLAIKIILSALRALGPLEYPNENFKQRDWEKFNKQLKAFSYAYLYLLTNSTKYLTNILFDVFFKVPETLKPLSIEVVYTKLLNLDYTAMARTKEFVDLPEKDIFIFVEEILENKKYNLPDNLDFINEETYEEFMAKANELEKVYE